MPHQAPLQPGDPRRVGRYRLAGRITGIPAEGPMYLGIGPDGAEVTLSVLHSEWTRDGAARDRFAAEAAVAKRVPPFCAARILDAGIDGDDAFLISEYVPGSSLLEVISTDGVLSGPDLDAAAIGMATGLASVHLAGLVHGNFGPEYVIMTPAGPRVVEFGITPPYGAATPAADMEAWAQTVVFAAAGKPATTIADLDVLPEYLRRVVAECLAADRSERPTARAAVVALIGDQDMPAGVLAEGSRRAVPGGGPRTAPASESMSAGNPGQAPWAVAERPTGAVPADDRPSQPQPQPQPPARPGQARPSQAGDRSPGARPPGARLADTRSAGPSGTRSAGPSGAGSTGPRATRPVTGPAGGRPSADRGSGQRPTASRHGRPADEPPRPLGHPAGHPAGQPLDRHGAHQQPPSRGRRLGLIVAGAVVVCALLVFLVVQLVQGNGSTPPTAGGQNNLDPGSTQTTSPSPKPDPTPTVVTPSSFAGSWSGTVSQTGGSYTVTIGLATGSNAGTIRYSGTNLSCAGALSVSTKTTRELTLSLQVTRGPCAAGTVTLTKAGSGSVQFNFNGSGPQASGTLNRS
jgi:hypothetical protein